MSTVLQDNERIEELRDEVLKLEDEGRAAKFGPNGQPVFVPRQEDSDARPA